MAGKAIPMGKSRPVQRPWLTIVVGNNLERMAGVAWEYKVLKAYTEDPDQPNARWFCAVKSPFTHGSSDMGDTYIRDVRGFAGQITLIQRDEAVPDSALPSWLRGKVVAA